MKSCVRRRWKIGLQEKMHQKLFSLLGLLATLGCAAAQIVDVDLSFSSAIIVEGGLTHAICEFRTTNADQTVSSVTWTRNTEELTSGGRLTITNPDLSVGLTEGESRLDIDSAVESDTGDYACIVEFSSPTTVRQANIELTVNSELVVEAEPEQTAVEGELAVLLCNVSSNPSPRIRWERIQEGTADLTLLVQEAEDTDFGMYQVSEAVTTNDAGSYRCTGQYPFGDDHKDIELVVLTVPVITTEEMEVTVVFTNTLHLDCTASGIKEPTYRWLFDGEELVSDGGRVEVDGEGGSLWVSDVTYDDAGEYTCVAKTGAGTDNITQTVAVEGPPEIQLPRGGEVEVVVADNTRVEIKCPFRSLPAPSVIWFKVVSDDRREEINSLAGGFTIFTENGSLLIWNVSQSVASNYDCILTNKHGSDNRTFFLQVVELPYPPEGFRVVERGDQSVRLEWSPAPSDTIKPVAEYVLELVYTEERGTVTATRSIPRQQTMYLADDLVPGVTYTLVLRSSNLAGVSTPTPSVTHTTAGSVPRLEFFEAESLGDGRSILLQWRLLYSGGRPVNNFFIEVREEEETVQTLRPDVFEDSLLLDDLRPSTNYSFLAVVGNSLGVGAPLETNASTPIAAPSKPTTPELEDRSPQTLTLSFSVKHGSYPILYYLLLISDPSDPTLNTSSVDLSDNTTERVINMSAGSVARQEAWEEGGEVVGNRVSMRVSGLRQRESYMFSVAAASVVGVGEFSDRSRTLTLEDGELLLYLIVGGVVGGVLLMVVLLVVFCFIGQYIRHQHRGGKMTITRRGSDSTGVATDYNLRFESFNGGLSPPGQGTTSPNPSQRVDSTTPPPRITSPRLTSPLLHSQHYYNSLRKYQLDTLPVGRTNEEGSKGRVVEVQIHSNVHNNSSSTTGATTGTRRNDVDGGHHNRPTSHPPSLPFSVGSQPPPFLPPPSLTSSSTLPTHPSYNHPTSRTLYSVPRMGNTPMQMSMSALPTADDGRSQVVGSKVNTLPRGATISDNYTVMQRVEDDSLMEKRFHSLDTTVSTPATVRKNNLDMEHPSYQTDV